MLKNWRIILNQFVLNVIYPMATLAQSKPIGMNTKIVSSFVRPFYIPSSINLFTNLPAMFATNGVAKFFTNNHMEMFVGKRFFSKWIIFSSVKNYIAFSTAGSSIRSKLNIAIQAFRKTSFPSTIFFPKKKCRMIFISTFFGTKSNSAIIFLRNLKRILFTSNRPLNLFLAKFAKVEFNHLVSIVH